MMHMEQRIIPRCIVLLAAFCGDVASGLAALSGGKHPSVKAVLV
jgi:hypothetical protein